MSVLVNGLPLAKKKKKKKKSLMLVAMKTASSLYGTRHNDLIHYIQGGVIYTWKPH